MPKVSLPDYLSQFDKIIVRFKHTRRMVARPKTYEDALDMVEDEFPLVDVDRVAFTAEVSGMGNVKNLTKIAWKTMAPKLLSLVVEVQAAPKEPAIFSSSPAVPVKRQAAPPPWVKEEPDIPVWGAMPKKENTVASSSISRRPSYPTAAASSSRVKAEFPSARYVAPVPPITSTIATAYPSTSAIKRETSSQSIKPEPVHAPLPPSQEMEITIHCEDTGFVEPFNVGATTAFKDLFDVFPILAECPMGSLVFSYGTRVLRPTDTPRSVDLQPNSTIVARRTASKPRTSEVARVKSENAVASSSSSRRPSFSQASSSSSVKKEPSTTGLWPSSSSTGYLMKPTLPFHPSVKREPYQTQAPPPPPSDEIEVTLHFEDTGYVESFPINTSIPFKDLFEIFAAFIETPFAGLAFQYGDRTVLATHTPLSINLQPNSTIIVRKRIKINVHIGSNKNQGYSITSTTPLRGVHKAAAAASGHAIDKTALAFKGKVVSRTDTPQSVGLKDGDEMILVKAPKT